jgi:hypothetical protein
MRFLPIVISIVVGSIRVDAQQVTAATDCAKSTAAGDHATMDHAAHMAALSACEKAKADAMLPKQAGQAVFAALGEVVKLLDADPATDWTKVNLEALRQHLLDMDAVTMRAQVNQVPVAGGFRADVTGSGATVGAIKRMVVNHARMLDQSAEYSARTEPLANGVRFTLTVKRREDVQAVARIRGLGFAGSITEGMHHAPHHLAIARGNDHPHGH